MKSFTFDDCKTLCGRPSEWKELRAGLPDDQPASVLDLRTGMELGDEEPPSLPEGWTYVRYAITGETVSEQDIDVVRREQRRHGRLIVMAPNDARASLVVLAGEARRHRRTMEKDELSDLKDKSKEKTLLKWLEAYLERHQTTSYSA